MKIRTLTAMLAALIILPLSVSVFADTEDDSEFLDEAEYVPVYVEGSESEVGDGVYKGYNLYYEYPDNDSVPNIRSWWWEGSKKSGYTIFWAGDGRDYSNAAIKIPDSINGVAVVNIRGGCRFKTIDLNPKNNYLKCVDNVIFSKDGKRLISYAEYDERAEYIIPDGTEIIAEYALSSSRNLTSVIIPDSVKKMERGALSIDNLTSIKLPCELETIPEFCFWSAEKLTSVTIPRESKLKSIGSDAFQRCYELSELYLPSFDIEIDRSAFGEFYGIPMKTKLKSYVQPTVHNESNSIKWDNIPSTSYYEIYQKLNSGEYKLMSTTKGTSCKLSSLKSGSKYTFAVKPVAVIPAANYDKEKDKYYPESFTIEGAMSEDIVIKG